MVLVLNSGNNGISERSLIGTGFANGVALRAGNNGGAKQIRVTFEAAIAAWNWQVDHAAIGIWAGTGANTPVELTFSGAHGFNIAQGATITSHWVTVPPFTTSNVLVVITDQSASNGTAGYTEFNLANSSGSNLTVESLFGFPPFEARVILSDAHRKIHLHFTDRSAAAQSSHQRSQRSAEARLAG
jgi:hypothetical protein